MLSKDQKVKSMCNTISTCGEDLFTLSATLRKTYLDEEVDVDKIVEDIKKVAKEAMHVASKLEKEIE